MKKIWNKIKSLFLKKEKVEVEIKEMSRAELKALAKELGIDIDGRISNNKIIEELLK